MKPVAAPVAITTLVVTALLATVLTLTGPTLTGPTLTGPTLTGPTLTGPTLTGPTLTGPLVGPLTEVALAGQAPAPALGLDVGPALRLDLMDLAPRVVTADGPGTLTVAGTLTNTGKEPVDELVVRVQRGDPLRAEGELRDALDGNAGTDAVTPQFTPLADELAPGGRLPVRLTVPLRGDPELGLALARTGVYELLVNVNGVPRDGTRARLVAVRLLLPVLSLPVGSPPVDAPPKGSPSPAEPFSLLYPIVDTPRRLSTVPGEPVLLTDDGLAASFAPGGRLGGLVAALAEQAPPGSRVRAAVCLAVDADLVETAAAMSGGYQVRAPDGAPVAGTGAEVAKQWLDALVAVAHGGCVLALPYADADIVALTRGGLGSTAAAAITDGRRVLSDLLQTPVVPDVVWPVDGYADEPTLGVAAGVGGRALLLSADGVEQGRSRRGTGVPPIARGGAAPQFAVLTDPLLTLAARGPDEAGGADTGDGAAAAPSAPADAGTPLSTQDAIGALAFRTEGAATPDGPLVLAPPHQWAAEGAGARALLGAVDRLLDAGRLVPDGLDDLLAAGPPSGAPTRPPVYPLRSGGQEIRGSVVDTIRATSESLTDLRSAVVDGSGVGVSPDEFFAPLRKGLVRPASAAWRGRPDAARDAGALGATRIGDLRATVRVLEPPSPYSLGTSDAPLPLTVANGLPVTVQVRIEVASTSGLRVTPTAPLKIPPLGRRQVSVNATVTRSGQFTVEADVRTPDGGLLGLPSRLKVRSTAYGTITVWLTASAGVLLVVLAARRVLRRHRRDPGRRGGQARSAPACPATRDTAARPPDHNPAPEDLAPTERFPTANPYAPAPVGPRTPPEPEPGPSPRPRR